jgi:hypothetical protein
MSYRAVRRTCRQAGAPCAVSDALTVCHRALRGWLLLRPSSSIACRPGCLATASLLTQHPTCMFAAMHSIVVKDWNNYHKFGRICMMFCIMYWKRSSELLLFGQFWPIRPVTNTMPLPPNLAHRNDRPVPQYMHTKAAQAAAGTWSSHEPRHCAQT